MAIEHEVGWQRFVLHVSQAATLVRPDATDSKVELLARYATVRSFAPAFLDAFAFRGSRSSAGLLKAVGILRESWHTKRRSLPEDAPVGFIRRSWRAFVLPHGKISRRPHELCVLSELRDRLRAGDVWVEGSQHHRSFDAALIPQPSFDRMKADGPLPVAVSPIWDTHLEERRALLHDKLALVTALARISHLPDARSDGGELKITPLKAATPPEADIARNAAYDLLPWIRITDLLLEVDRWTGFSACFTHQRTGRPADERTVLLATVLADGINLGLTRMAETCSGVRMRQPAWVHDWHIREETYAAALACVVDAHRALLLSSVGGDGTSASSDGRYFRSGSQGSGLG